VAPAGPKDRLYRLWITSAWPPSPPKAGQAKAGQAKAGQAKAGQAKAGQAKAGQAKAGQAKAGQAKAGQAKAGAERERRWDVVRDRPVEGREARVSPKGERRQITQPRTPRRRAHVPG
jgi:hypothetical protein